MQKFEHPVQEAIFRMQSAIRYAHAANTEQGMFEAVDACETAVRYLKQARRLLAEQEAQQNQAVVE